MLKSGGPTMTVTSIRDQGDGIVHCEWFAGGELKRDAFDAVNLTTAIVPQLSIMPAPSLGVQSGCGACNWGRGVCACLRFGGLTAVSNAFVSVNLLPFRTLTPGRAN
jgi:uncharacterized protein YodC (DUF2158 family)